MRRSSLAVLVSGGLDSAILLGAAARRCATVVPVYVRGGLPSEAGEFAPLSRFVAALATPKLKPIVSLSLPMDDVYGPHWSLSGRDIPAAESPDQAVYLPGRNVVLLSKAMIWCHLNRTPAIALA